MTELPIVAMALARNGYITVMQDGPTALTEPGRVLARLIRATREQKRR